MTYEQLLEKVSVNSLISPVILQAIVRLHKPLNGGCESCYQEGYFAGEHYEIGKYPCLTMQLIEQGVS